MAKKWTMEDLKAKGVHVGEDGIGKKLVKPKANKYGVNPKEKRTYNGTIYASTAEMKYRIKLDTIVKYANEENPISKIEEQVKFPIEIKGIKCFVYILDYRVTYSSGVVQHIDVKGSKLGAAYAMFRLKKKCVEAYYGIEILER